MHLLERVRASTCRGSSDSFCCAACSSLATLQVLGCSAVLSVRARPVLRSGCTMCGRGKGFPCKIWKQKRYLNCVPPSSL